MLICFHSLLQARRELWGGSIDRGWLLSGELVVPERCGYHIYGESVDVSEKGAESGAFCRRFLLPLHPC
jgi:hypothetical protein